MRFGRVEDITPGGNTWTSAPTTRPSLLIRLSDLADEQAWAELVEIYGPLLHRLAKGRGLQQADAEDLAQEVFRIVSAAIEGDRYDPSRGSFRGWLFRIARNLTLKALVARRRQPRGSGDTGVLNLLEEQPAPASEDSAQFGAAYQRRLLEWAARRVRGEFSDTAWRAFLATGVEARPRCRGRPGVGPQGGLGLLTSGAGSRPGSGAKSKRSKTRHLRTFERRLS